MEYIENVPKHDIEIWSDGSEQVVNKNGGGAAVNTTKLWRTKKYAAAGKNYCILICYRNGSNQHSARIYSHSERRTWRQRAKSLSALEKFATGLEKQITANGIQIWNNLKLQK